MRTAGLGKTFEQWHHEIQEEKTNADRWEKKFREAQARNEDLKKCLSESRNGRGELKARVAELEKSLHQYRNCNTAMELRASLSKIEEMKRRIEELEASLQNYEIQFFEANEDRWKEQLHHAQYQVRNRDYLMGEAITQIQEYQMQEQLAKIQREMNEQMVESQREIMSQLSQLLLGRTDKGKGPMDKFEETNEDPQYLQASL
ncbi:tropomyosin-1-like [Gossypium hirsutum]|uniref:Tropomyosin-1-like n=1 Tax=Gossypium hirsutum TaxID=3635 RepID=A0ABM2YHJ7_GOSHI|nr:tropomyosin-1-like [Gossypium hirsutum]